ncbi:hypothetical protein ACSR9E_06995 [Citrobacter koseri]|uniref:hypothetical protein n=1 Tax=Citrobacter koseri TaxID=545 RepID=UPI0040410914
MSNIDKQGRQVQRYANYGVDMIEWADGGYVKHSDYLAQLDDLEAAKHTAAVDHEAACSLVEENEEVKRKLVAAEKRIAELEARTVNIPDLPADCDRTEAHFKYQEAIREAGIKIAAGIGKGE